MQHANHPDILETRILSVIAAAEKPLFLTDVQVELDRPLTRGVLSRLVKAGFLKQQLTPRTSGILQPLRYTLSPIGKSALADSLQHWLPWVMRMQQLEVQNLRTTEALPEISTTQALILTTMAETKKLVLIPWIEKETGLDIRTVMRNIGPLRSQGALTGRQRAKRDANGNRSTAYVITSLGVEMIRHHANMQLSCIRHAADVLEIALQNPPNTAKEPDSHGKRKGYANQVQPLHRVITLAAMHAKSSSAIEAITCGGIFADHPASSDVPGMQSQLLIRRSPMTGQPYASRSGEYQPTPEGTRLIVTTLVRLLPSIIGASRSNLPAVESMPSFWTKSPNMNRLLALLKAGETGGIRPTRLSNQYDISRVSARSLLRRMYADGLAQVVDGDRYQLTQEGRLLAVGLSRHYLQPLSAAAGIMATHFSRSDPNLAREFADLYRAGVEVCSKMPPAPSLPSNAELSVATVHSTSLVGLE